MGTQHERKQIMLNPQERKHFGKPTRKPKKDYFQLRMTREWKDKIKMVSEMNNTSLSEFIRTSVDKNIQSLTL